MRYRSMLLAIVGLMINGASLADEPLSVVADFQGASVRVLEIDQKSRSVSFMPGGDPKRGWPCWWCFRIDGLTVGETLTLRLQGSSSPVEKEKPLAPSWAMPKYATFSLSLIHI